ncbi:prepilin-type N-terminal cleavage/methylation domain-containing protein [Aquabacterium humicola]|uniref:prepilin-type N-terminal cleavage/methylation domain-containing protein n=1 Tax=Aquabacterium humicola TaxID=3237377 RepID=UPI0025436095|nr:prepilin-type N-terminal cleavage/methylation domain-containing protein [Rubrivivax pictus]
MRHRTNPAEGYTLIELLVVLAILALLLTLAVPRYFHSVDHAKETVLRENLRASREALGKFRADTGRYPDALEELVARKYLTAIPIDPMTDSASSWVLVPPEDGSKGQVADLRSSASGQGRDGRPFQTW